MSMREMDTSVYIQKNIWDQDQTAPMKSWSILIASKTSFNNDMGRYVRIIATYAYING